MVTNGLGDPSLLALPHQDTEKAREHFTVLVPRDGAVCLSDSAAHLDRQAGR
jgi:hypothetical protein